MDELEVNHITPEEVSFVTRLYGGAPDSDDGNDDDNVNQEVAEAKLFQSSNKDTDIHDGEYHILLMLLTSTRKI